MKRERKPVLMLLVDVLFLFWQGFLFFGLELNGLRGKTVIMMYIHGQYVSTFESLFMMKK